MKRRFVATLAIAAVTALLLFTQSVITAPVQNTAQAALKIRHRQGSDRWRPETRH